MKRGWRVAGWLALLALAAAAHAGTPVFRAPDSYPALPPAAVQALHAEGCRIPQGAIDGKVVADNVVTGAFARKGQRDVAVLCGTGPSQSIRIFWGGPAACPSRIAVEAGEGEDDDRAIGATGRRAILSAWRAFGGPKPPPITHQAVEYAILEKASVIYYCHGGRWRKLQGAD